MTENLEQEFQEYIAQIISELRREENFIKLDLLWLFSFTLRKYSIQRYLNNRKNIYALLKRIVPRFLALKYEIRKRSTALALLGDIKVRIIDRFDDIISRKRELFDTLSNILSNIITSESLDLMISLTRERLRKNNKIVSFLLTIWQNSVNIEGNFKLPINNEEYLKNVNFLRNSVTNPGDFYFNKYDDYFEIDRLCMGTLNYLANHILETQYGNRSIKLKITYKLTATVINKIQRHNLIGRIDHEFDFWDIGDEFMELGIGYYYPYFTTMNQETKLINLNFIIPEYVLGIINQISFLPEIENFQTKISSFDTSLGAFSPSDPSHDFIKDYIAENSDLLREGLRLISEEYQTGEVGTIDILFKTEEDDYLVVEIKKETPRYEPLGQIMAYMNWVKENLAEHENVFGIIICEDIHPQLRAAFDEANNPNIQIWRYDWRNESQRESLNFEKSLEIEGKLCPFCRTLCSPRARNCPSCGEPF